jgi:hypothetical protein
MLLKGLVVAASLAFCVAAVVAPFDVAPSVSVVVGPRLAPVAEANPERQPPQAPAVSAPQRELVSVQTIECTEGEGCSCGSKRWVWSDGTPLSAEELTRMNAPSVGAEPPSATSPVLPGAGAN